MLSTHWKTEMITISLKLPEDLMLRATAVAREAGVTQNAFMVEAIRQVAASSELKGQFIEDANAARAQMLATGVGCDAGKIIAYLRERLLNSAAPRA